MVFPKLLVMYADMFLGLLFSHAGSGNCCYAWGGLSIVFCIEFPMAMGSAIIIHCGLWSIAISHGGVVVVGAPWFGLLLSCFGHVKAKNNSVFPYGLERCSSFVGDCPRLPCLHRRAVNLLFCCGYAVVGLWTVLA